MENDERSLFTRVPLCRNFAETNLKKCTMETEKKLKLLQLFYSGALADASGNYEKYGIKEQVTAKKAFEQEAAAKGQLFQLGIESPEQLFRTFSDVFGCIDWKISTSNESVITEGTSCLLCAIAKKKGISQPCSMFCINPMTALAGAIDPSWKLNVRETLWDSGRCRFELTPADR